MRPNGGRGRHGLAATVVLILLGAIWPRLRRRSTRPTATETSARAETTDRPTTAHDEDAAAPSQSADPSPLDLARPRRRRTRTVAKATTLLASAALLAVAANSMIGGSAVGAGASAPSSPQAPSPATALLDRQDDSGASHAGASDAGDADDGEATRDQSVSPPTAPPPDQRAAPETVAIPAIGVEASVIPLAVDNGTLEVPEDFAQTGWWRAGPEPGEAGPAVIVGHVDSFQGPAVFFRLRELSAGDRVEVHRVDGSSAVFEVTSTVEVLKDEFPTEEVYGPTEGPTLRLITCNGDFAAGSYLGNLIVNATLVAELDAPSTGTIR